MKVGSEKKKRKPRRKERRYGKIRILKGKAETKWWEKQALVHKSINSFNNPYLTVGFWYLTNKRTNISKKENQVFSQQEKDWLAHIQREVTCSHADILKFEQLLLWQCLLFLLCCCYGIMWESKYLLRNKWSRVSGLVLSQRSHGVTHIKWERGIKMHLLTHLLLLLSNGAGNIALRLHHLLLDL